MILMAIDHVRDFVARSAMRFLPTDGSRPSLKKSELSHFWITRGLWSILLELTLLGVLMFSQITYRGDIVMLLILWAIAISMIALALPNYFPPRILAGLSVAILGRNLLDVLRTESLGRGASLWNLLCQQNLFFLDGREFGNGLSRASLDRSCRPYQLRVGKSIQ
jgi:uncharacterized membrane protein